MSMTLILALYLLMSVLAFPLGASAPPSAHAQAAAAAGPKLIALTFDDGPKPYVLMGTRSGRGVASQSLLDLLDRQHVKATFFVMGWRLSPNADAACRKLDGGVCREAAEEEHRRGEEIENHTYGHGDFKLMEKRYGDAWILKDIERASVVIQGITGTRPHYLRPPDWDIWPALQQKIEAQGYHVMSKSTALPPALRDVDSEDYFCVGQNLAKCPKPSDYDWTFLGSSKGASGTASRIIFWCSMSFHNPSSCYPASFRELQGRGYRFVTLREYMAAVVPAPSLHGR